MASRLMLSRRVALCAGLMLAPARALLVNNAASAMPRRAVFAAATSLLAVPPAFAAGKPASDGSWAKRFEAFEDSDFAGFKTAPSGLQYKVFEEGYGVKPVAGQKIKAHYAGYLLNGAKFDSSYDRRSPLEFNVGTGRVIKGWDEALLDMQVGEKRILKIPSGLACDSNAQLEHRSECALMLTMRVCACASPQMARRAPAASSQVVRLSSSMSSS